MCEISSGYMENLYSIDDRMRLVGEAPKQSERTDFERDRDRVLHSSALRRLGAKTQVHGPYADDFSRTRLTHSLEVAQVGRSLAKNFGCDVDIVETACLAHDLGHPPFGHNGETALAELSEDIGGFEGNAQTLRILTRLEQKRFIAKNRPIGLNLTRATLDAVIKYPWLKGLGPNGQDAPKFGAYTDDEPVFNWVHGKHGFKRCIEAQIMDLADDIAYSVHDVEDAIARNSINVSALFSKDVVSAERFQHWEQVIESTRAWYPQVSAEELLRAFERLSQMPTWPKNYAGTSRDLAMLKDLTSDLIGRFISAVISATTKHYGNDPLTRYAGDIIIPPDTEMEITLLKGLAVHFVMEPRAHKPFYYEQRTLLFDLMDAILQDPENRLEPIFLDFWHTAYSQTEQQRVIIDQLASLTDQSARTWHARYCGMLRH